MNRTMERRIGRIEAVRKRSAFDAMSDDEIDARVRSLLAQLLVTETLDEIRLSMTGLPGAAEFFAILATEGADHARH